MNRILVKGTEILLVLMFSGLIVLVFGNVVLRYGFDSGIVASEELSRFLFMWMTLVGALLIMRENGHLGVTLLVNRLTLTGRRVARFISDAVSLLCCALLADGTFSFLMIAKAERSPVTGISMGWVYASLLVCSVGMCILLLISLFRQATGRMTAAEYANSDNTSGE